jgi:hypothetical protein
MLTLSMALAVAGGGSFLGWSAPRPWRVLVVDGEMAAEDLQDRLRMLAATVDRFDQEAANENLMVLARQDQRDGAKFPDIASPEGQEEVMRLVRQHRADLVILDNFSTLAEVADENEAGAMNPVLSFLLNLKAARIACVLVHHSGKGGTTYRGSSKLATTFEVILGLLAKEDGGADTGAAFTTEWTKFRGAPDPSLRPKDVVLSREGEGEGAVLQWIARDAERDGTRRLLSTLETGRFANQKQLAEEMGVSEATISRTLAKAYATGATTEHRVKGAFSAAMEAQRDPNAASDF